MKRKTIPEAPAPKLVIQLNEKLYLRDPQQTELGRSILENSVELIDKLGIEEFTFAKLARKIETAEASVYRYFENKHKLLIYLVSLYWELTDFRISFALANIQHPGDKLQAAIRTIVASGPGAPGNMVIDETKLRRIILLESAKAYMTKQVDDENRNGLFFPLKRLSGRIADIITEISPGYRYPNSLASTLIEMAYRQPFFAEHLPALTDIGHSKPSRQNEQTINMLIDLATAALAHQPAKSQKK